MSFDTTYSELIAIAQVIFIDLVLAGDNAIVVGMAAARVAPEQRRRVIAGGIAIAVVLRILFATATSHILSVIGLSLAGGLLLLWVCWKLYRELREQREENDAAEMLEEADVDIVDVGQGTIAMSHDKSVRAAMIQVVVADVSMSLDNVIAVAGAAEGHIMALVVGLTFSVVLMGIGATVIARVIQKHGWIAWLGLALIGYVAVEMILTGAMEVAAFANS